VCLDPGKRWRPGRDYHYVARAYSERVNQAGGIPLLLGVDCEPADAIASCDGIILTGGEDLPTNTETLDEWLAAPTSAAPTSAAPASTAPKTPHGIQEDATRIRWDREIVSLCASQGTPLFGICYGMQLLNLHFGGTLYRDLHTEHPGAVDHGGAGKLTQHSLDRSAPSELLAALPQSLQVNSSHGQAVRDPAPGFTVTATSSDGVIEAIERAHCYGVEWHPETDAHGAALFDAFVRCASRAAKR
jgi:putative glutamine amidotransferase